MPLLSQLHSGGSSADLAASGAGAFPRPPSRPNSPYGRAGSPFSRALDFRRGDATQSNSNSSGQNTPTVRSVRPATPLDRREPGSNAAPVSTPALGGRPGTPSAPVSRPVTPVGRSEDTAFLFAAQASPAAAAASLSPERGVTPQIRAAARERALSHDEEFESDSGIGLSPGTLLSAAFSLLLPASSPKADQNPSSNPSSATGVRSTLLAAFADGSFSTARLDESEAGPLSPGGSVAPPRTMRTQPLLSGPLRSLCPLPGSAVAIAGDDRAIAVCSLKTGELICRLEGHLGAVTCLAALHSGAGARVASGSDDRTVVVWDVGSASIQRTMEGHSDGISALVALPRTRSDPASCRIASASFDGTVRIWDADSGRCLRILAGHSGGVAGLALLLYPLDHSLTAAFERASRAGLPAPPPPPVSTFLLASAGADAQPKLWRMPEATLLRSLPPHEAGISSLCAAASACATRVHLAVGCGDGGIRLWDVERGVCISRIQHACGHSSAPPRCLTQLGDGRVGSCSGLAGEGVRAWCWESEGQHQYRNQLEEVGAKAEGGSVAARVVTAVAHVETARRGAGGGGKVGRRLCDVGRIC